MVADLVGDYLFTDSAFLERLGEKPGLARRIYNKIKQMYRMATAGSKEARQLEQLKNKFEKMFQAKSDSKADTKTDTKAQKNTAQEGGVRYSIAGVSSNTSDPGALNVAKDLLSRGVDSETIRQETGWFKGYDGKWRYEVNDSEMEIVKNLTSPVFAKYIDGDPFKLDDVIKHDAIFDAYPELRDIDVQLKRTLGKNIVGAYDAKTDILNVSGSIYLSDDMFKEVLIHEMQHKIQNIEGFARGSSPQYWEANGISEAEYERFVTSTEREKAKILKGLTSEERQNYLRYVETDRQIQRALGAMDMDAILRGDDTDAKNVLNAVEAIEAENDALYNKLYPTDWFTKLQEIDSVLEEGVTDKLYTVFYKNTAGEIEARDVSQRVNYTDAQRKNIRPDIDRANVTFSYNDNSLDYIGDTRDGRRCYRSGFGSNVSMDDRIAEFKKRIATIFNLGAVELKTDVKKIRILGDRFTSQKNLFGDKTGGTGEYETKINALYDLADILATAKYDPASTNKEPSYANPNIKPKNAAHKDVKYWYKFENEIVFDGVPYTVTFNIRDKGAKQYQYLIDFHENKTPGLSNTVVKNLLRADQASYMDSIRNPAADVNRKFSLSDSAGRQLSKGQQDYFAESQARDDLGQLVSLYHGTENGGFTEFDPQYSDDGISLFMTDNIQMAATYSNSTDPIQLAKGKPKILRWMDGDPTKGKGQKGVYNVYANLKNPLIVDAKGENWDNLSSEDGYQTVRFQVALSNKHNVNWSNAGIKLTINTDGQAQTKLFGSMQAMQKFVTENYNQALANNVSLAAYHLEDGGDGFVRAKWNPNTRMEGWQENTREIARKAKAQGYDGVIIRNVLDSGKYGQRTDNEKGTVYIAFDSNQIKSVDNKNPTADKDIRYSLSQEGQQQRVYGDYRVSGEDVMLEGEQVQAEKTPLEVFMDEQIRRQEDEEKSREAYWRAVMQSGEETESVGAAPSGFDPVSHLQYEYGSLPDGEKAVRDDSLPKSTTGKDRVSLTARTVKGAKVTPDAFVDLLDQEVVGGKLSYMAISNNKTTQDAIKSIQTLGWEEALSRWKADVRAGKVSAELTAKGALLLNNAAKAGDSETWLDVLHDFQYMNANACAKFFQKCRCKVFSKIP